MTGERVFILVVAVAVGAGAVAMRLWWSFAGMVILVLGVAYGAWRQGHPRAPEAGSGTEHQKDPSTHAGD